MKTSLKHSIKVMKALGIKPNTRLSNINTFDQQTLAMWAWSMLSDEAKDTLLAVFHGKNAQSVSVLNIYNFALAYAEGDKQIRRHFYFHQAMRKLLPASKKPGFMLP